MPTASVTSPMIPPRASTSRTKCPFAIPPIAGLQDIWAIKSTFSGNKAVFSPIRAVAIAASHPACPAPTTTTSNCSSNGICQLLSLRSQERLVSYINNPRGPVADGCSARVSSRLCTHFVCTVATLGFCNAVNAFPLSYPSQSYPLENKSNARNPFSDTAFTLARIPYFLAPSSMHTKTKVVAAFLDGRRLKGFLFDFSAVRGYFFL